MYLHHVHQQVKTLLQDRNLAFTGTHADFVTRLLANTDMLHQLFMQLYGHRTDAAAQFGRLLHTIVEGYMQRPEVLRQLDADKLAQPEPWFISHTLAGMSLYVDRMAGNLQGLAEKLAYFEDLGINLLHLMPIFESPAQESDGGYAVSDFRKVDARFGTLHDLETLRKAMHSKGMYLMLDIVLNHTSHQHAWAQQARAGHAAYMDYYYFYPDRTIPDQYETTLPEVFPESAPGNFTYIPEVSQWVMTVFHNYQWDLNYTNPAVLVAMLENIFFYANLGVDVLRIDAPAFIWKKLGTHSQNLAEAHTLLRIIKLCVQAATPGMALLGEAIVAPSEILKYFGTERFTARECDFAYNATHMALQWDAIATGDTRVLLAAQHLLVQKPYGTSWITYTRCHDDIGLGYDDYMIQAAGYNPYEHRRFLKDYYSGAYTGSPASGALFAVNPKTGDARISGTLASLCGLEKAMAADDEALMDMAIKKIVLMQAHTFFIGGLPMLFYGDEVATLNDYSYLSDADKSYDNRWMHRPLLQGLELPSKDAHSPAARVYAATQQLLALRRQLPIVADRSNLVWMNPHNIHVAGYVRAWQGQKLYCVFNFSDQPAWLTWYAFREQGLAIDTLQDLWAGATLQVGRDDEYLVLAPYQFCLLQG